MIAGVLWTAGRWLLGSQLGQVILIVTAVFLALTGLTWKVARDARAAVIERVLKETVEESSRRLRELNAVAAQSAVRVLAQRFTVVRHIKHHLIHAGLRRFAKHIHETRKDVTGVKDGVVVAVDYFLSRALGKF